MRRVPVSSLVKLCVFAVVTILLTSLLAITVSAGSNYGDTTEYSAKFTDASGIDTGDQVRIAGVKVGQVTSVGIVDNSYALVRFEVKSNRKLPTDSRAAVKYLNLAGQRYLAVEATLDGSGEIMEPGGTIPVRHTRPALNLTELFNGFQPLFQLLSPKDVNKLSYEIIKVLQGQQGTIESLVSHMASLTTTIAKKDKVIGKVIDNLNQVLTVVNQRSPQLAELITALQRMVSGFAGQREEIGDAVSALGELTKTTKGLLQQARKPLEKDIAALKELAKGLSDDIPQMEQDLQTLPKRLNHLLRTVSYGSWFNFFMCRIRGSVSIGKLEIEFPLTPVPPSRMPKRCYAP